MCKTGDVVYAVVKNNSTFRLETTRATVTRVTETSIFLERPESVFVSTSWEFPKDEWNKSIFFEQNKAQKALEDRVKNGR